MLDINNLCYWAVPHSAIEKRSVRRARQYELTGHMFITPGIYCYETWSEVQDLRFSQQHFWGFQSSGMWHCAFRRAAGTSVVPLTWGSSRPRKPDCLTLKIKALYSFWNVRKCSLHNTVTLLSEAHTLHMSVACSWPAYRQNMFTDLIISRVDLNCKSYHYSQCYNHKTEHNNVKITATLISRTTKATRNWSPPIGPITSSTRLQRKWLCLLWAAVWPRNTWHTATCEMKCHVLLVLYQHITSTMFCTILHIVHSD